MGPVSPSRSESSSPSVKVIATPVKALFDRVPSYGLRKERVGLFLTQLFGSFDFAVQLRNDQWVFWIPRALTPTEKYDLLNMRFRTTALDEAEDNIMRRHLPAQARPVLQAPTETLEIDNDQSVEPSHEPSEVAIISQAYCRICLMIYSLWFVIAAGSLAVGLWRSFAVGDEGKGFTDAAYVVAVGGLILFPLQTRHNQRCQRIVRERG